MIYVCSITPRPIDHTPVDPISIHKQTGIFICKLNIRCQVYSFLNWCDPQGTAEPILPMVMAWCFSTGASTDGMLLDLALPGIFP